MPAFDPAPLILLLIAGLGYISHNKSVTIAMLVLLVLRLTPLNQLFPWVEKHGLTAGIIILTVAMMAPIATGKMTVHDVLGAFTHWKAILAIIVGVFVAWLGGRGVSLISAQPQLVISLMIGTIIGIAFLKGVPVGPLIAAGLLSLVIGKG